MTNQLLYTAEEAAKLLSVGITTVKDLIRTGELHTVKIRRCRHIPAYALHEYIERLDGAQNGGAS